MRGGTTIFFMDEVRSAAAGLTSVILFGLSYTEAPLMVDGPEFSGLFVAIWSKSIYSAAASQLSEKTAVSSIIVSSSCFDFSSELNRFLPVLGMGPSILLFVLRWPERTIFWETIAGEVNCGSVSTLFD